MNGSIMQYLLSVSPLFMNNQITSHSIKVTPIQILSEVTHCSRYISVNTRPLARRQGILSHEIKAVTVSRQSRKDVLSGVQVYIIYLVPDF